jgi:hypothetical protein
MLASSADDAIRNPQAYLSPPREKQRVRDALSCPSAEEFREERLIRLARVAVAEAGAEGGGLPHPVGRIGPQDGPRS